MLNLLNHDFRQISSYMNLHIQYHMATPDCFLNFGAAVWRNYITFCNSTSVFKFIKGY